ncbi:hypothetical protein V1478_014654 [Vespula squamosa]|uniref:Uncharacterized protein n=1 Tax=Vespula squamosa TaxID=30214 RepID=A0ABD2A2V9_VESSQ
MSSINGRRQGRRVSTWMHIETYVWDAEEDESHGGVVARAEASRGIRNDRKRKGISRWGGFLEEESYESANSGRQGYSDNPSRDRDSYKDAYKVDETPADARVLLDGPYLCINERPRPQVAATTLDNIGHPGRGHSINFPLRRPPSTDKTALSSQPRS